MKAPIVVTIRPGVTFTPAAGASFLRVEHQLGRRVDVNSTYRDWDLQMSMYRAWQAYVNGTGPKPNHSRAIHPKYSVHCQGLALDSDDWRNAKALRVLTENGWIRTAANDPTERHHFEYQWWRDQHRNDPTPTTTPATPAPEPEEEDDDMYKPTIHARLGSDNKTANEWTLGHPSIGRDLDEFTGILTETNHRSSADGKTTTYRGFIVTADKDTAKAWARTHAKGAGNETSRTIRLDYIAIQRELSRIATEAADIPA